MRYLVIYATRKRGSIGSYDMTEFEVSAESREEANVKAFNALQEQGLETFHCVSVVTAPEDKGDTE